ncbi:MAG: hypothetical protein R3E31_21865 [Chloroflexota bacterium]|nr:hypothetical protein [Anaerolineales bacterium]MCB8968949.1 hypothetical protein [Ardenticatenaceae bacterium]
MDIQFFDNSFELPKAREDVRFKQIGLFVYEDLRRVAVGLELTPFLERPCIDITVQNSDGVIAGSMVIIETLSPNITLTMHLRDKEPTEMYELSAQIYYDHPEKKERENFHRDVVRFAVVEQSEQIFQLSDE